LTSDYDVKEHHMKPHGITEMFLDILRSLIPPVLFKEDPGKIRYETVRPLSLAKLRAGPIPSQDDLGTAA